MIQLNVFTSSDFAGFEVLTAVLVKINFLAYYAVSVGEELHKSRSVNPL